MKSSIKQELIFRSILGTLSGEDKKLLASNPDLKQEVEEETFLHKAALRHKVKTKINEGEVKDKKWKFFKYVIAILLTLGIAYFFLYSKNTKPESSIPIASNDIRNSEDVYNKYSVHISTNIKRGTNEIPDNIKLGVDYYNAQNYSKTISIFQSIKNVPYNRNYPINFYLGNSYLHLKQPDKAIATYEKLLQEIQIEKNEETRLFFETQSKLQMSLAYILKEENNRAISILKDIEDDEDLGKKVKNILTDLQNIN